MPFSLATIFGLPVHVLVVHAAVTLVPLAAIGLIATGWRSSWRHSYALPVALLAVAGAGATLIAAQSGEALQASLRYAAQGSSLRPSFGDHPEQGDTARNFAMLFALTAVGFWAAVQWGEALRLKASLTTGAYVAGSVTGGLAIVTMVIAGHSGATLVWKDLGNFVSATRG
jgi:hypothetical protein